MLADILRESGKEKVTRIIIATLRVRTRTPKYNEFLHVCAKDSVEQLSGKKSLPKALILLISFSKAGVNGGPSS